MSYDNCINNCTASDLWRTAGDDIGAASLNPMATAEARAFANDIMNDVIDFIESRGFEITETPAQIEGMTQGVTDFIMQQALDRITNQGGNEEGNEARASSAESGGSGGGTSIFERIALALGQAMVDKANELVELAESVPNASDGDVLLQSAKVTAAGQELNVLSQTFNSTINSVGQAASTAARKQ